uniref:MARVEL domain-containing protein n=1 Tax=Panagrolaimus sp. JU765 TaxID=591449 RepID=A0AC34R389_9BILA
MYKEADSSFDDVHHPRFSENAGFVHRKKPGKKQIFEEVSDDFSYELPQFEPWYLVTETGIFRIVQAASSLLSFGLVTWVNALFTPTYIVQATLLSAFGGSTLLLIVYASNLVRTTKLRWIFHELVFVGLACFMVLLSLVIMSYSATRYRYNPWILSVLFLFFCFLAFLADFVSLLSYHRKNPWCCHSDANRMRNGMDNLESFERT